MSEPTVLLGRTGRAGTRRRPRAGWGSDGVHTAPPPFANVLCGVDGSRASAEAVRQALTLCAPESKLGFLAVSHTAGVARSAQTELSEEGARAALDDAAGRARTAGLQASAELRHGSRVSDQLLDASAECDLLAIGCHGGSRLGGMMLGSTATQIAHRAEVPLLVARRSAGDRDFPREILLASDGSPGSWAAARTAARLALARGSELQVVYVPDGHPERYRELFKQMTAIERLLGYSPSFTDAPGDPLRRITGTARARQTSLIVLGKRGLRGIRALGSVSERVVHRAPCSVLVVPPGPGSSGSAE